MVGLLVVSTNSVSEQRANRRRRRRRRWNDDRIFYYTTENKEENGKTPTTMDDDRDSNRTKRHDELKLQNKATERTETPHTSSETKTARVYQPPRLAFDVSTAPSRDVARLIERSTLGSATKSV